MELRFTLVVFLQIGLLLKQFWFKSLKTRFSLSEKLFSNIIELLFWRVHLPWFPGAYEMKLRLPVPCKTLPIHPWSAFVSSTFVYTPASLTLGAYSTHIKCFVIPQHSISHPTHACRAVFFFLNPLPSHSCPSSQIAKLQLILCAVAAVSP